MSESHRSGSLGSTSHPRTLDSPVSSTSDGFLGAVARWKEQDEPTTARTSRMIGSKLGVSPPPPPGPPPSHPPPLPPVHPYASTSRREPPSQPIPQIPALDSSLPSSVTGHRRTISVSSRTSKRLSSSPPRVSPRTSSLVTSDSPSSSRLPGSSSETARPKAARTPSRHLLQTALDLAQRAVEMDRNNDVLGALAAYREAVTRLKSVMERVGVEPREGAQRRASGRTEEEGRTLRGIHDAYVARIELLASYEDELQFQETPFAAPLPPVRSGAASSGEQTPRPSIEETAAGIGNLMLGDDSPRHSIDSLASPFNGRIPRTSSISDHAHSPGPPIQPPPRRTSMAAFSPPAPSPSTSSQHAPPITRSPESPVTSISRRRVPSRSMGIETELDINEDEEIEVLARTPRTGGMLFDPHGDPTSTRRGSESLIHQPDRAIPPPPNSAPLGGSTSSQRFHDTGLLLVSPNVNQSNLAQRRLSRGIEGSSPQSRKRLETDEPSVDPTTVARRTSVGSRLSSRISSSYLSVNGIRASTDNHHLSPQQAPPGSSQSSMRSSAPRSSSVSLVSPAYEPQPAEIIHRSFHILRILCISMDPESTGAYLTAQIHLSPAIWQTAHFHRSGSKLGPPKIIAPEIKYRLLETLCFHLDIIRSSAAPLIVGPRDCNWGQIGELPAGVSRQMLLNVANDLINALDAMDEDMQAGYKALMKGGVQVQSWKGKVKKSGSMSWGSKLKDKMTTAKVLESPDKYVDLLSHFSFISQVLNDHLSCFSGRCTAAYASLPEELYTKIEARVTNAAQFYGAAVVPFILDDTMQFITRYLKGGVKYLED